jgi:hypothetical protein
MKGFVREHGLTVIAMAVATLVITSIAGGSVTVLYLAGYASLAIGLLWEALKERAKERLAAARSTGNQKRRGR